VQIEVPIYEDGRPTGRALAVPDPPPDHWARGRDRFELKMIKVCRRFGCGCFWEDVRAYVPEGWGPSTSAAVHIEEHDERRRT